MWFDELLSVQNANAAGAWWDLLLRFKTDNNHHLTSLYLHALGPSASSIAYRFLSFAAGVATVPMAWLIGARESRVAAIATATLFATSTALVFYASEARGYAPVVCLTLAAWYSLQRYIDRPDTKWAVSFAACSVLGVMAHQTFVLFYIGAFVWCDVHLQRTRRLREATRLSRRLFIVPTGLIGVFALVVLRGQQIDGGPPFTFATVVAQAFAAMSSGLQSGVSVWIVGSIVAGACVAGIWSAYRAGDDRWVLFIVAGAIAPALIVIARQPPTLAPRYFLVPATILLAAAASWVARLMAGRRLGRGLAVGLVASHVGAGLLFVLSDAASRGHYEEAIRRMLAASPGTVTVAASDRYSGTDYRTQIVVAHYRHALSGDRIRYVSARDYHPASAEWMIVESLGEAAEADIFDRFGQRFTLDGRYATGVFSGTSWYLYRRAATGSASSVVESRLSEENAASGSARFAFLLSNEPGRVVFPETGCSSPVVELDLRERPDDAVCVRAH
jgi:hypothetical protein